MSNNSFKPNLLRYSNNMAEKACHVLASTTQVGLIQALGMPRIRTALEQAAGKLTSAIQKHWVAEMGEPLAKEGEQAMHKSQLLARAVVEGRLADELGGQSVSDYLGSGWVRTHPSVVAAIKVIEALMAGGSHA